MFAALISAATGGSRSAGSVAGPASATRAARSTKRMMATKTGNGRARNGVRSCAATGVYTNWASPGVYGFAGSICQ